jgi:hypothetical protein
MMVHWQAYNKSLVMVFQLAETPTSLVTGHSNAKSPLIDCGWIFLVQSGGYELRKNEMVLLLLA